MLRQTLRLQFSLRFASTILLAVAIGGCGGDDAEITSTDAQSPAEGQPADATVADTPKAESNPNDVGNAEIPEPSDMPKVTEPKTPLDEVYAALDDAQRLLKEQKFREFAEQYAPPNELVRLQETDGAMEQFVAGLKANPKRVAEMAGLLATIRKLTPKFNSSNTQASFPFPGFEAGATKPPQQVETTDVQLTGFGSDLSVVLDKGLSALEAGEIESFVTNMFPAGELRRPDADKRREQIVARMKADPAPVQQMIADLKALKALQPTMKDSNTLAVYEIAGGTVKAGNKTVQLPKRTIKLQKVEDSWRMYDATTPVREEVARQSALPLSTPDGAFVKMIKLGSDWRIQEVND